jgi:hypothetical protein
MQVRLLIINLSNSADNWEGMTLSLSCLDAARPHLPTVQHLQGPGGGGKSSQMKMKPVFEEWK